jgi:hypothetical protein
LLRPKTDRGSLHFAMKTPSAISRSQQRMEVIHHSAQCGSHPSKNSPRQQPYRVTAAVALLPFGSLVNRMSAEALKPINLRADKPSPPSCPALRRSVERASMTARPCASSADHHSLLQRRGAAQMSQVRHTVLSPAEAVEGRSRLAMHAEAHIVPRVPPHNTACLATAKSSSALRLVLGRSQVVVAASGAQAPCRSKVPHLLDLPDMPPVRSYPLGLSLSGGWSCVWLMPSADRPSGFVASVSLARLNCRSR